MSTLYRYCCSVPAALMLFAVGCMTAEQEDWLDSQAALSEDSKTTQREEVIDRAGHKELPPMLLIHGAWHGAWAWHELQAELERAGVQSYVVDLPAHGADTTPPGAVQLVDYVDRAEQKLDEISDTPIMVVAHSMGGIVLSSLSERRPEMISKAVYLAAFLVPSGKSMMDLAMIDSDSLVGPNLIVNEAEGYIDINRSDIRNIFYAQAPKSDVFLATAMLRPNPLIPLVTPLSLTDSQYGTVPRVYIRTDDDNAVSPALQAQMSAAEPCEQTFLMNTDHSPFFSRPKQLARLLVHIARQK